MSLPPYSSLGMLKQALGMASADTTRDELLTLALAGASRSVEQYCDGRVFTLAGLATARTYSLGRRLICTDMGDRVNVDDIGTASGLVVEVGDGTTFTAITDVETHPDNALARGDAITAIIATRTRLAGYRKMRVTACWGWPDVPTAVDQATLLQASRLYWRKDSPGGVAGSAEWGMVRVPNLDPDVKALLAVTSAGATLNDVAITAMDTLPQVIDPPVFAVGEITVAPHKTFGGQDEATFTCYLFTSRADAPEGQRTARQAASSTGTASIRAALEAARGAPGQSALGGAADDLYLRSVRAARPYVIGDVAYTGAEFTVFVMG